MTKILSNQRSSVRIQRQQSLGEEIANSISHGIGFLVVLSVLPVLYCAAISSSQPTSVIGVLVFGLTAALLYLSSTLYHSLPNNRAKRVFQIIDHSAIFLLIAGTYTPFTLGALKGFWGNVLLILVWFLAAIGIVLKSIGGVRSERLSTTVYLLMGWMIVIAAKPALELIPSTGLILLLCGGISYTLGVLFFIYEFKKYFHFLWHLFVLSGTACHFFAVLWYS